MIRLLLPLLVACSTAPTDTGDTGEDTDTGGDTDTGEPAPIVVAGSWVDNWGGSHLVDSTSWQNDGSVYAITQYDNTMGYAIAQNGADNAWNPNLWSRFDWGWVEGELIYCQTAYAAATEGEAMGTPPADLSSPGSGCGGYSWSVLRAPFSLTDGWDDAWGGEHVIDAFSWQMGTSSYSISEVDEAGRWAVAQNGAANEWNPSAWSRFDWAWDADASLYYCQTAYAAATEAEALATPAADAADLGGGCGGFSWTELRPMLSINGAWLDGWGGDHDVNAFAWTSGTSRFDITTADDGAGWLVAQNAATNEWSPGLWSRFDWTWDGDGGLWYCQTAYAATTEAEAIATPAADATDPATTGCGSFSWSALTAE